MKFFSQSNWKVIVSTPVGTTRNFFFASMSVSLTETFHLSLVLSCCEERLNLFANTRHPNVA